MKNMTEYVKLGRNKRIRIDTYWSKEHIRALCINNALFTKGNNEEYETMLSIAETDEPTTKSIYKMATMICNYSTDDMTIEHVMFLIKNKALTTFYVVFDA